MSILQLAEESGSLLERLGKRFPGRWLMLEAHLEVYCLIIKPCLEEAGFNVLNTVMGRDQDNAVVLIPSSLESNQAENSWGLLFKDRFGFERVGVFTLQSNGVPKDWQQLDPYPPECVVKVLRVKTETVGELLLGLARTLDVYPWEVGTVLVPTPKGAVELEEWLALDSCAGYELVGEAQVHRRKNRCLLEMLPV